MKTLAHHLPQELKHQLIDNTKDTHTDLQARILRAREQQQRLYEKLEKYGSGKFIVLRPIAKMVLHFFNSHAFPYNAF